MTRKKIRRGISNQFSEHSIKLQKLKYGNNSTGLGKQVIESQEADSCMFYDRDGISNQWGKQMDNLIHN